MDILTVGIVTIPFIFEGEKKIIQALDGVEEGKVGIYFAQALVVDDQQGIYVLGDTFDAVQCLKFGEGENRVTKAIDDALHSPLLNNNDIFNAKKVIHTFAELAHELVYLVHFFHHQFGRGTEGYVQHYLS